MFKWQTLCPVSAQKHGGGVERVPRSRGHGPRHHFVRRAHVFRRDLPTCHSAYRVINRYQAFARAHLQLLTTTMPSALHPHSPAHGSSNLEFQSYRRIISQADDQDHIPALLQTDHPQLFTANLLGSLEQDPGRCAPSEDKMWPVDC